MFVNSKGLPIYGDVSQFLNECTIYGVQDALDCVVTLGELYSAYISWCSRYYQGAYWDYTEETFQSIVTEILTGNGCGYRKNKDFSHVHLLIE